jgi:hypothetical protein
VHALAELVRGEDDRERRAVIGRCQPTGVAVGQDSLSGRDQIRPEAADGPAHRLVLVGDRACFRQQTLE